MSLTAEHLMKGYKGRTVVNGVSLSVEAGNIVGLLGPNGAGKTTCFYAIAGLIAVDQGQVMLDHRNITHLPLHERARLGIGYLPQEPSVFRKLSVRDNIMGVLELRTELDAPNREEILAQLLHDFHLNHIVHTMGMSLSGGERRRVEIARALAANPKFILLDEPFAGVDPISVIDIKQQITQLSERNIGVLITDHNVRETLAICRKAYIMNEGHLIAEGTPQAILANQQVRDVYLGKQFTLDQPGVHETNA
ncbi:MAG: LPS export ABC transporter ATP-binding protein [Pseudomonadota bacterium]